MTTTLEVCTVDTPTKTYVKAIAEMDPQQLRVYDRQRNLLIQVDAEQRPAYSNRWEYDTVTVTNTPGCACGGLRIIDKESVSP